MQNGALIGLVFGTLQGAAVRDSRQNSHSRTASIEQGQAAKTMRRLWIAQLGGLALH